MLKHAKINSQSNKFHFFRGEKRKWRSPGLHALIHVWGPWWSSYVREMQWTRHLWEVLGGQRWFNKAVPISWDAPQLFLLVGVQTLTQFRGSSMHLLPFQWAFRSESSKCKSKRHSWKHTYCERTIVHRISAQALQKYGTQPMCADALESSLRHPHQHLSWISERKPVLRRKTFSLFRHVCIAGKDWASIKHANGHLMDVLRHSKAEK